MNYGRHKMTQFICISWNVCVTHNLMSISFAVLGREEVFIIDMSAMSFLFAIVAVSFPASWFAVVSANNFSQIMS